VGAELEMPGVAAVTSRTMLVIAAEHAGQAGSVGTISCVCVCVLGITSRRCHPLHYIFAILERL
jgi:hypothetical protein